MRALEDYLSEPPSTIHTSCCDAHGRQTSTTRLPPPGISSVHGNHHLPPPTTTHVELFHFSTTTQYVTIERECYSQHTIRSSLLTANQPPTTTTPSIILSLLPSALSSSSPIIIAITVLTTHHHHHHQQFLSSLVCRTTAIATAISVTTAAYCHYCRHLYHPPVTYYAVVLVNRTQSLLTILSMF